MDRPDVRRAGPLAIEAEWELPSNTGDCSQTVPIKGYLVEVASSNFPLRPFLYRVGDVRTIFFQTAIGGSFEKCADEGETCFCYGLVRFGNFGVWSDPLLAQGGVRCEISYNFPDVLQSQAKTCECNNRGVELKRGVIVTVRASARNDVGLGPYSDPGSAKVMGVPGPVSYLVIDPGDRLSDRIITYWGVPRDTGFGLADLTANITEYLVRRILE